jgi:hypothetical protein
MYLMLALGSKRLWVDTTPSLTRGSILVPRDAHGFAAGHAGAANVERHFTTDQEA